MRGLASALLLASWLGVRVLAATTDAPPVREAALDGVWTLAGPAGQPVRAADGSVPPLSAAGKAVYSKHMAQLVSGDTSFDLSTKCKPLGFPRILWDGGPFDIQVQDGVVFFGYTWNRNHRLAYFANALPPLQVPRFYGTTAAHWDGDTLVIDSGLYNENTLLDSAGLPHSEEMMLRERYRTRDDGRRLTVRVTVTDPKYYTRPWDIVVNYDKDRRGRIAEDVCEERSAFYRDLLPRLRQ
jgi:hypothetical protein